MKISISTETKASSSFSRRLCNQLKICLFSCSAQKPRRSEGESGVSYHRKWNRKVQGCELLTLRRVLCIIFCCIFSCRPSTPTLDDEMDSLLG